jgi:hypothetical protein
MYVRCPYCEKIHHHGFTGDYMSSHRCVPHCNQAHSGNYEIQFPFSGAVGDVGYEIDKERALFIAAGADPTEYFSKREDNRRSLLMQDMRNRRKWSEAIEMIYLDEQHSGIPGGYSYKKINDIVSAVIQGHVGYVRQHLESSTESDILLHGVEAYDAYYPDNFDPSSKEDADESGSMNGEPVRTSTTY